MKYICFEQIARKVMSYVDKAQERDRRKAGHRNEDISENESPILPLHIIESFIASLTNNIEGKCR